MMGDSTEIQSNLRGIWNLVSKTILDTAAKNQQLARQLHI